MRSFAALATLAVATYASAYTILRPNAVQGWTDQGPQVLTWQRGNDDPLNFTALLVNEKNPSWEPQVLAALIVGDLGNTTLNPPNGAGGGWPTGSGFRVHLVNDTQNLGAVLARTVEFNIIPPNTTDTTATTFSFTPQTVSVPDQSKPAATDPPIIPPNAPSAATSVTAVQAGVVSFVVAMVGLALA